MSQQLNQSPMDINHSRRFLQQVQEDLERSQAELRQMQYRQRLKTAIQALVRSLPHATPSFKQPGDLLGLSHITSTQFWRILDPIINAQLPCVQPNHPKISILTPTWNSELNWFVETVLSVLLQTCLDWEWCIVDDGSRKPEIRQILTELSQKHPSIKVEFQASGGISAATNKALQMATADYICFLDHDDTLAPNALQDSLDQLAQGFDVVYSDEDKIDFSGQDYLEPFFKPDWSPEYFRGVMYAGHLLCVRRNLALAVGGFKGEFDGVQDYEFLLRVSEQTSKIGHISKILYHWRKIPGSVSGSVDAKAGIDQLQQAAVNAHLKRLGLPAQAEPGLGRHRVNINPNPKSSYPLVSILVTTSDVAAVEKCLHNLVSCSTYLNWEMIWVEPETSQVHSLLLLQEFPVKKLTLPSPFKASVAYNLAAQNAQGEYLLFLNPTLEFQTEDYLRHLVYYAEQTDVGAVGGLLISPQQNVQQAGLVINAKGNIHLLMKNFPTDADGYAGSLVCAREVSAVNRYCMMVKAQEFKQLGGFNEYFYNDSFDIDFCIRLRQLQKRIIFTPRAVLVNSNSTVHPSDPVDQMLFVDRCHLTLEWGDPYYNSNFDPKYSNYTIAK